MIHSAAETFLKKIRRTQDPVPPAIDGDGEVSLPANHSLRSVAQGEADHHGTRG
jgi:hypothetical protein